MSRNPRLTHPESSTKERALLGWQIRTEIVGARRISIPIMKLLPMSFTAILTAILAVSAFHTAHTTPAFEWVNAAGGDNRVSSGQIVADADGNTYITGDFFGTASFDGVSLSSAGDKDIFVAKVNAVGEFLWARRAGSAGEDFGAGIALDGAGNVYVTGGFSGTATFSATASISTGGAGAAAFLAKYNSAGTLQWVQKAGGTSGANDYAYGYGVGVDGSGRAYIAGQYYGSMTIAGVALPSAGDSDVFIARFNAAGTAADWGRRGGGNDYDAAYGLATDAAGNSSIVGEFYSTATFGAFSITSTTNLADDVFVARYDSAGTVLFAVGDGGTGYDYGERVALDGGGNTFISGGFESSATFGAITVNAPVAGEFGMFAAKYDGAGDVVWARWVNQSGSANSSIAVDSAANSYVTTGRDLDATPRGELFVTKLDISGLTLWTKTASGSGSIFGRSIAVDLLGNSYALGNLWGGVDFDGVTFYGAGQQDALVAKLLDDHGVLTLSAAAFSVYENIATLPITVTRSGGNNGAVSVHYATANGSAAAGSDYGAMLGTLNFSAGQTSALLTIPITNDAVSEGTETFTLTLSAPRGGALTGSPAAATISILNGANPAGLLQFSAAGFGFNEDDGTAAFTVTRSGGSTGAVSVQYATSSGSAFAGSDFTGTSGTLSFASGETSKSVNVALINDSATESNETFTVTLSSPGGGAYLGAQKLATGTIVDDDQPGVLQFAVAGYSVYENVGTLSVSVTRTGGSTGPVSVQYATANGSAFAGSDYTAASGTLSFANGETAKIFSVAITNDAAAEGAETFTIGLSTPSGGATLGSPATTTVTIRNGPNPSLQLSSAAYSRSEDGGSVAISVVRTGDASVPVSVAFATANGTAVAGADYAATTGTLNFAAGQNLTTFSVPLFDDTTIEPDKTFTVSLSAPTSPAMLGAPSSATVTIVNDDEAFFQFDAASQSVAENVGSATMTVTRTGVTSSTMSVAYATANGAAAAPGDFTAESGTLTFAAGETSKTIEITLVDDGANEPNEAFTVALSNPTGGASLGSPATRTVTILNDDTPRLRLSSTSYSAVENAGAVVLTVTRAGGDDNAPASATYAAANGTAIAGNDFTGASGSVSLAGGELSRTFSIALVNDTVIEANEVFSVTLSAAAGTVLGSPATATVTIANDDTATFQFASASHAANEASGAVALTVTRVGDASTAMSVNYATANGGAVAGSDFGAASGTLTFAPGENSKVQVFALNDDVMIEPNESFSVALSSPAGGATLGAPAVATITILNDDSATFRFDSASGTAGESAGEAVFTVSRMGDTVSTLTVDFATLDGTATAGADYTATSGTLVFAPDEITKTITVPILHDAINEPDETFFVDLLNPAPGTMLGTPSSATFTIMNADIPSLRFSTESYSAGEADGAVQLTVTRSGDPTRPISVNYATSEGTALGGADFTATNGSLNFASGEMAKSFTVLLSNDSATEPAETFTVALGSPVGATLGAPSTAEVTIVNDDVTTFAIELASYASNESAGSATIRVLRAGDLSSAMTVDYATADGTAVAGSDYTAVSGTLSFAAGQTSRTFAVALLNDAVNEPNETISLALSAPGGGAVLGVPAAATLTIVNDDNANGVLQFSAARTIANENGGAVSVSVSRLSGLAGAVSVQYATSNGSALGGADFTPTSGVLNFAANQTTASFTVPILNDAIVDVGESFAVTLSTPGGGASLGAQSSAVVAITDDENPAGYFEVSAAKRDAIEGDGAVAITVLRRGGSAGTASLGYTTSNGSAVAGSDYTAMTGTLTFAAGETSKTVSVPLLNDATVEATETFYFSTYNPTGGAEIGALFWSSILVADDDAGTLEFSAPTFSVNENAGPAVVIVTRSGGSVGTVTVNYATSNGTALAGSDYTAATGTLTFGAGETSKNLNVAITNDTANEASETFNVTLSAPGGGANLGAQTSASVSIQNDDTPALQFAAAAASANESAGSVTFTVTRSGDPAVAASVQYATADGTAVAGSDYTAVSGTLSFAAGQTSRTFAVALLNDAVNEPNETISLALSAPGGGAVLGVPAAATLTIVNDDNANGVLQFSAARTIANENGGAVSVSVSRLSGLAGAVSVQYATSNGSALGGADFTPTSGVLNFAANQTTASFTVPILNDAIVDVGESFAVTLSTPGGGASLGAQSSAVVAITDDENPAGYFEVSAAKRDAIEGDGAVAITVLRRGGSAGTASLGYTTSNGSAVAGSDYTAMTGTLTFAAGETSKTVSVPLLNDATVEATETFYFSTYNPTGGAEIGALFWSSILVADDDAGTLEFSAPTFSVNENAGPAVVIVTRSGGSVGTVTVNYATSNGTALAGSDYTAATGTLTFGAGETSKNLNVAITNDTANEASETFNVTLSAPGGGANLGAQTSASVSIQNDDTPALQFAAAAASANESAGSVTFTVTRSGDPAVAASVQYATADGTAVAGSDYTAVSGTLSFAAGQTSRTFAVALLNDAVNEPNETISLALSAPGGGAVLGVPAAATLTIVNDDNANGVLQFSAARTIANENGGAVSVSVSRLSGLAGAVSVQYATSNGSALGGADFTPTSGVLNFAANQTTASFTVPILNDAIVDVGESFAVTLSTPGGGASLGAQSSAVVAITDDENPAGYFEVSAAKRDAIEGDGAVAITVLRRGGSAGTASLGYTTSNGSAVAGSDYTAMTGTLTFAAGETSKTVSVPLLNDATVEATETFYFSTYNPTGGAEIGALNLSSILVTDDDNAAGTLQFSAPTFSGTEGAGSAVVTVRRIGGSAGKVTVHYATSNGTALAGSDYSAASGTLRFNSGQTSKTFNVTITNDALVDPNESFSVSLSAPAGGATLGSLTAAAVNIVDND